MAFSWLVNRGDPNHLLSGMILQAWLKEPPLTLTPSSRLQASGQRRVEDVLAASIYGLTGYRNGHKPLKIWVPILQRFGTMFFLGVSKFGFRSFHDAIVNVNVQTSSTLQ